MSCRTVPGVHEPPKAVKKHPTSVINAKHLSVVKSQSQELGFTTWMLVKPHEHASTILYEHALLPSSAPLDQSYKVIRQQFYSLTHSFTTFGAPDGTYTSNACQNSSWFHDKVRGRSS